MLLPTILLPAATIISFDKKLLSHVKYSSKRSDFLRFYLYFCHAIDDFACLDFAALGKAERV